MVDGGAAEYVPKTPPLRLRPKLGTSKKKLSRVPQDQVAHMARKYAGDNQADDTPGPDATPKRLLYALAAAKIQRAWRSHAAKALRVRLQGQIGRPAQLQIHGLDTSAKWLRMGLICLITVLRRPYGPRMYTYKTEVSREAKIVHAPFFVPIMSSNYDVIVTVAAEGSKVQNPIFLGQAVLSVADDWAQPANFRATYVPFGTYRIPIDAPLQQTERTVEGRVELSLVPLNPSMSSFAGQMFMRPSVLSKTLAAVRHRVGKLYMRSGMSYESSLAWCKDADHAEWGVLTETHLSLYHPGGLTPYKMFDLRRIQLVRDKNAKLDTAGMMHFKTTRWPLQIYHDGTLHTFYINSKYEKTQWINRIDGNRRKLLVP
ncbi:hypothetical protein SDRG_12251 [Saprolegnia diclina VS20]|uniref:PH domain-containing protein n=1 Tax=Saprolegnia diclina (strain VS20) TaxID=1156394 RepID=T0RJG3_SAPDV|nr:hypothetical protein SDRG_12251 [Saprolegnia diclina VS20]EQC29972.1 hypothetical protein SDRG_12251 [Saprolegnia diclina VS20]|eukprot:XP_008616539.1 hypothetical protein SDRG_12251 [Saprolegnia diclina VS20]